MRIQITLSNMNHQQLQLPINWLGLDIDMVQNAKAVVELLEYILRGNQRWWTRDGIFEDLSMASMKPSWLNLVRKILLHLRTL